MRRAMLDAVLLAERNLRRLTRNPDMFFGLTIQPIMFVVLFAYIFGGAIKVPGYDYIDFFFPGIAVQMISFTGYATALGISEDLRKGLIDRFRSLPMTRWAVIAGRTLSDVILNAISLTTMLLAAFLIGFGFQEGALKVVAGIGLILLFGFAMSWVYCYIGLVASTPDAASAMIGIVVFPLSFISSAYVPTDTMPKVFAAIADANPVTTIIDALRHLWIGTPAHTDVFFAVVWCVGIAAAFAVLSTRRYRRATTA